MGLDYAAALADQSNQQSALPGLATSCVQDVLGPDVQVSSDLAPLTTPASMASPLPSIDAPSQPDFMSSASDLSDVADGKDQDCSLPDSGKNKKTEGDGSDGKGGKPAVEGASPCGQNTKNDNRLGGGAGKRLTFKELQACFGVGLKEAAAQLGICPTTLKRACRRNGVSRWPSRQISKLSKAWHQMGYQGSPPEWLVHKAITGNLKCDNLAFSLNAGLHLGLMQTSSTQPVSCPPSQRSWTVGNNTAQQRTLPTPAAAGLQLEGAGMNIGSSSSQAVPLSSIPADQPDFFDEMAGILQEPTAPLAWNGPRTATGAVHALHPEPEARRVFRSGLQFGAQQFQCGSPDLGTHVGMETGQGQGGGQSIPLLSSFDGLGDAFTPDAGLAGILNRPSMENIVFNGMDVGPSVNEMGIASELF